METDCGAGFWDFIEKKFSSDDCIGLSLPYINACKTVLFPQPVIPTAITRSRSL